MKYEIKIEHAQEAKGAIDLERLTKIAQGMRKVSKFTSDLPNFYSSRIA